MKFYIVMMNRDPVRVVKEFAMYADDLNHCIKQLATLEVEVDEIPLSLVITAFKAEEVGAVA